MFDNVRNKVAEIIKSGKNSMTLPNDFLRYGNKDVMRPDWTRIEMSDVDHYTGYGYAAIRNRANSVAKIAIENIRTESKQKGFEHPYLKLMKESSYFSPHDFWYNTSTYLDLEGVMFYLVVRDRSSIKKGSLTDIKYMKLLNPYEITRIREQEILEIIGYKENKNGFERDLPLHMVIPVKQLNPFNEFENFGMTDAAREAQFTLKTKGDYTRHSLKNSINAPGIITTDIVLDPEKFKNFQKRVSGHKKGEPIFGNGSGKVTYQSMEADLQKSALKDVNEISRDELLSVSGQSKTMMGIEQSGTTRDTARVQKELNIEGHILPQINLVLDALNQDYKMRYPEQYAINQAVLVCDNPVGADHESDKLDNEVKKEKFALYDSLIAQGYNPKLASQYVNGEIGIEKLKTPTEEPRQTFLPLDPNAKADTAPTDGEDPQDNTDNSILKAIKEANVSMRGQMALFEKSIKDLDSKIKDLSKNAFAQSDEDIIASQRTTLENAIVNIEEGLVMEAIERVQKKTTNAIEINEESDVLTKAEKKDAENQLNLLLVGFYGAMFVMMGNNQIKDREQEFGMTAKFTLDRNIKAYIKATANKVSESHIETISKEIYETARQAASEGLSQTEIIARIKQNYATEIVNMRAKVIARTETNRAFTRAQFDADQQFIKMNNLEGRAFKKWETRSSNPCVFCESLEREGEVPFNQAFRGIGDDITVGDKTLKVNFESLEAGNAHPNCSCIYRLVIRKDE